MIPKRDSKSFVDEVIAATPHGERIRSCLQCGTCAGSCPNGPDMDRTPREIINLITAGRREEVLSSSTMWVCVSCYLCTARCPKQIPITDIMYTLKRVAINEDYVDNDAAALARNFHRFIDKYGRSFEFGLATRYYLTRKPGALLGLGPLGLKMFSHGRMSLRPSRIRNIDQLKAILNKAREIEGAS